MLEEREREGEKMAELTVGLERAAEERFILSLLQFIGQELLIEEIDPAIIVSSATLRQEFMEKFPDGCKGRPGPRNGRVHSRESCQGLVYMIMQCIFIFSHCSLGFV